MDNLNDPGRADSIRAQLLNKYGIRHLYEEMYALYAASLSRSAGTGGAVELGSGAGFVKHAIPSMIATDILPYTGLDAVVDGTSMPFADCSVRFFCMWNVLHHVPDAEALFREIDRCLVPGGRVLILDQHVGWISKWILRYLHHEPFHPEAREWAFETDGPLTGANGALAWIIFRRDIVRFQELFPSLSLRRYRPHTPLRFWLAGGLKPWSLIPRGTWGIVTLLDNILLRISAQFGSFVEIELEKIARHVESKH